MVRLFLFILVLGFAPLQGEAAPRVVVSIAPVHSLVAGVMEGVAEPQLLAGKGASPHTYMMKPSERRALGRADLIVWVGENIEGFLVNPLASLGSQEQLLELMALDEIKLLAARRGGEWQQDDDHHHGHGHHHGDDHHDDVDGHLWLDPHNAREIVNAVAARLAELDPINAARYRANADHLLKKLDALDAELEQQLAPIKQKPYLVFHDGYHYFEARYGLNAVGSISVDPERKPGARRLKEIRKTIQHHDVSCVFYEPQFPVSATRVVTEGSSVKSAVLDPMGVDLKEGAEMYFQLMRGLAAGLVGCLQ